MLPAKNCKPLQESISRVICSAPILIRRRPLFRNCLGLTRQWYAAVSGTVEIILTERVPVAHWRVGGLVDSKGNVFAASLKQDLPIFEGQQGTGKDMVKHYADFSGILSPLKLTIKELIYTPRSAWLLVLNNGITVRLGRENEIKRLQQFAQIWPSLLREKQSRIEYVDMRYKDGFSVRYRPSENPSDSE